MAKFYKVLKDHPMWEVGTILSNEDTENKYKPISDLFVKDVEGLDGSWYEGAKLVENQTEWFGRVYKVTVLKQAKYLTREAAKKAHEKLYEA
jgi:hypothetical protein